MFTEKAKNVDLLSRKLNYLKDGLLEYDMIYYNYKTLCGD